MLIINESGFGGGCFLVLAAEGDCRQVVIRIAAYQNRISNRFYVCFDLKQLSPIPIMDTTSVALRRPPSPYIKHLNLRTYPTQWYLPLPTYTISMPYRDPLYRCSAYIGY
jgi:hypothetical protein